VTEIEDRDYRICVAALDESREQIQMLTADNRRLTVERDALAKELLRIQSEEFKEWMKKR